ncbi:unnamed protein product [Amaranthus hypochondriacus]
MPRHSQISGSERRERNEEEPDLRKVKKEKRDNKHPKGEQNKPERSKKVTASSPAQKIRVPNASPFSPEVVTSLSTELSYPAMSGLMGRLIPLITSTPIKGTCP